MVLYTANLFAGDVTIIDSRHYSNVFGEIRNFRIFLPPGYFENPQKKYPVIYYYHGWSQRYFGSDKSGGELIKGMKTMVIILQILLLLMMSL